MGSFKILILIKFLIGVQMMFAATDSTIVGLEEQLDRVFQFRNTSFVKYDSSAQHLLAEAQDQGDTYFISSALRELGFKHIIQADFDSAIYYLDSSHVVASSIQNDTLLIYAQSYRALALIKQYKFFEVLELYHEIVDRAEEVGYKKLYWEGSQMLGNLYRDARKYTLAKEYYNIAIPDTSLYPETAESLGWWSQNIGLLFFKQENYALANHHYNQALAIWEKLDMGRGQAFLLNLIGQLYLEQKKEDCLGFFERAEAFCEDLNLKSEFVNSGVNKGRYYEELMDDSAQAFYHYKKAFIYSVDNELSEIALPAIDFFFHHPEYMSQLPYTMTEMFDIRLKSHEKLNKENYLRGIKLHEAIKESAHFREKTLLSNKAAAISQESAMLWRKFFIFTLVAIFIAIALLLQLGRNWFKLKSNKHKIATQYKLISEQSSILEEQNRGLLTIKKELEHSLKYKDLKLVNNDKIISMISALPKTVVSKEVNRIVRSNIDAAFIDDIKKSKCYENKELDSYLISEFPRLTKSELLLCSMIIEGHSYQQISQITVRSYEAIKTAIGRIRKKMGFKRNVELELYLKDAYAKLEEMKVYTV